MESKLKTEIPGTSIAYTYHISPPRSSSNIERVTLYLSSLQGCSFVFSCGGLSPHNLGQKKYKILHLSQKMCQIRREIVN